MKRVLPAEWEHQDAIVIAWPNEFTDWKNNLSAVEKTYIEIANHIASHQQLIILSFRKEITHLFNKDHLKNIRIIKTDFNDTWTRDYLGLSVLVNTTPTFIDFKFNGWGNKFNSEKDNSVNSQLVKQNLFSNVNFDNSDFILEGGSIDSNGNGTILTTKKCLLNKNRNSKLNKDQIENKLRLSLGADKIIWLKSGEIPGDDTDAHIDTLARFCAQNTLVYSIDSSDELQRLEKELKELASNHKLKIVPIELPKNKKFKQESLPATYVNFLITNHKVLIPIYNDPNDIHAINTLQKLFPKREIVGINCLELIKEGGSLHCITMQIFKNVLNLSLKG